MAEIKDSRFVMELNEISKTFGGVHALESITFNLQRGKIIALVGENGAGKSTLINIISGLYYSDTGYMTLESNRVLWDNPKQALDHGIAVVHQELTLFPNLTVAENVFAGKQSVILKFGRLDKKQMYDRTKEILNRLNVEIDPNDLVETLSLSNQQMVEIAKALMWAPKILILDEATSALDNSQVEALFSVVRELSAQDVTVLIVSHRMYELLEIADMALVLKDGKLVKSFDSLENVTQKMLVETMLGREINAIDQKKNTEHNSETMLSVHHVSNNVLKDVSLHAEPGKIIGFGGLRGHGQEEILRVLFGLSSKTSGEILFDGKPYVPHDPMKAIKAGFAYVPPDRKTEGLILDLSVEFNLTSVILGRQRKLSNAFGFIRQRNERQIIHEIRDKLQIMQKEWRQQIKFLSGGNQQKVAIGKWLKSNYRILLMDEPTRGIDVATKREIYHFLRELSGSGISILFVSTDSTELLEISDRIYVFYEGGVNAVLEGDEMNETCLTHAIMGN